MIPIPCPYCPMTVDVYKLGIHLTKFCRSNTAAERSMKTWNEMYPAIKSYERGEITEDQLKSEISHAMKKKGTQ